MYIKYHKLQYQRIVSFLPSATEILYELGAAIQIAGVTHECNYPTEVRSKPRVINSSFDASTMSNKEIDDKVVELFSNGKDIYIINEEILKELKPDLIVAQGICEVCSPFTKEIKRAISILGYNPKVIVLDPHNVSDILDNITEIATNIRKINEGKRLVRLLEDKIKGIKKITELKTNKKDLPKILCLEWLDPFFSAGHWVPEMVAMAGGINGLTKSKERSQRTSLEEIKKFDPDKIILMPCGFNIDRTLNEYKNSSTLNKNQEWNNLRAIKNNELYVVDAGSYFSKPGPRTITGIEILAKIISPNKFNNIEIPENSYSKLIIDDLTNK
jgi:iron complex transport system substrate-binding protein